MPSSMYTTKSMKNLADLFSLLRLKANHFLSSGQKFFLLSFFVFSLILSLPYLALIAIPFACLIAIRSTCDFLKNKSKKTINYQVHRSGKTRYMNCRVCGLPVALSGKYPAKSVVCCYPEIGRPRILTVSRQYQEVK